MYVAVCARACVCIMAAYAHECAVQVQVFSVPDGYFGFKQDVKVSLFCM